MVLPDGTWTPPGRGGRLRTLQRQQNLFHWDLEVVVGSQIEVVPTATGTQEAPFTQESQGTCLQPLQMSVAEDNRAAASVTFPAA